jgi:hypothetical protein
MLTIELGALLRQVLATPSRDLVTRPTGAQVRRRIHDLLAVHPATIVQLEFSGIGLVDCSCADEVVAKLLRETEGERYLIVAGVAEAHAEAIDHVLARQDLAVMALPREREGGPTVLGRTTPELLTVFRAILTAGPGDATRLAALLAWTPERTADALQTLALQRLVRAAAGTFAPLPLP